MANPLNQPSTSRSPVLGLAVHDAGAARSRDRTAEAAIKQASSARTFESAALSLLIIGWALSPTELRFAELAAHFEATIWSYAHGGRSIKSMLPAERLAAEFTKAWRLLHGPSDEAYRRTYSRWFATFYIETKNTSGLAEMQRENRPARRELSWRIDARASLRSEPTTRLDGPTFRPGLTSLRPDSPTRSRIGRPPGRQHQRPGFGLSRCLPGGASLLGGLRT